MSLRTRPANRSRQAAVASVEFVLLLPIILTVFVLMMHMLRIGHLAEELAIETRSIAWREALHDKACFVGGTARNADHGDHILVTLCGEPDDNASDKFLGEIRDAGRNDWSNSDNMTQVLANTAPAGVETTSATLYRLRSSTGSFSFTDITSVRSINDLRNLASNYLGVKVLAVDYAVDARDGWLRSDLQLGFDNYYDNRFKKHILFPDYFPCATGDAASAERPTNCEAHETPDYDYDGEPIQTGDPDFGKACRDGCRDNGGLDEGESLSSDPFERASQINACIVKECKDL